MDILQFIVLLVEEPLDCVQFLEIMNKTAVNLRRDGSKN